MPVISIKNVRLAGLAAAVPPLAEPTWSDLALAPGQCANALKRNRTPYRRKANPEQCQSDFCAVAAKELMDGLGWKFTDIDAVVMVTATPDYPIPPTAIILQDRLGVPKTAVAFDLPAGDAGFLHGLQVAASFVSSGHLKKALLFSGDVSKTSDDSDSGEPDRVLSGDNGCVFALEYYEKSPAMVFDSGGDGAGFGAYHMPVGGTRNPPQPGMYASEESIRRANDFIWDVKYVADSARRVLPDCLRRVLEAAEKSAADIDGCYLTSVGLAAKTAIRKEMEIPRDRLFGFTHEFGDCKSGSIPLAMIAGSASRLREEMCVSLLGGIGPGLAWGGAVVSTDQLVCPDIIEY